LSFLLVLNDDGWDTLMILMVLLPVIWSPECWLRNRLTTSRKIEPAEDDVKDVKDPS
jgi:hypothetical protein